MLKVKHCVLLIAVIVVGAGTYFAITADVLVVASNDNKVLKDVQKPSVFGDKITPIYTKPMRVFAESVNLDVNLVEVGVTQEGVLEAPKKWNVGGWYIKSARAGELGTVVIDGHYDDSFGNPAAFWNLKNLNHGDKVYLVDTFGRTYPYRVTEIFYIDIFDPRRLTVLESDDEVISLTMITCGGVWLSNQATYSKRLVVRAVF